MGDAVARLRRVIGATWSMTLYPSAGEGGGVFVSARRRPGGGLAGAAVDPERSVREAGRRARAKIRRYCAANGLNRLGTLTYRPPGQHDPVALRRDVGVFFRRLRAGVGGEPLPYVWVPEWHKTGHGLHVHFAVGRFVPRGVINQAWGRGFISIKLLGDLPVGSRPRDEARVAARYLSKYVAKTFEDERLREGGLHRYEVGQGFQPVGSRLTGTSADALVDSASDRMGGRPKHRWDSWETAGWQGPPAVWVAW
ncbi:MAG: hypothetical protein M9886_15435 [Candidatus Nanopelagicales bacterium]|nr:hypothetical protein [Candidatus Nanopelagicales bacterium]